MKEYISSTLISCAFLLSPLSFAANAKKEAAVKEAKSVQANAKKAVGLALVPVKITTDQGHVMNSHIILNNVDLKNELHGHHIVDIELMGNHKGRKIEAMACEHVPSYAWSSYGLNCRDD